MTTRPCSPSRSSRRVAASRADVFYTENSPALAELSGKGLLAPIEAATLATVPAKYSSPTGDWVGVSARVSAIVYNTDELTPAQLPTSVMDLADPKWKGKLALAPGETDFQPIVTSIAKTVGDQGALAWLTGVKANLQGHDYPDNETIVAKVNSGDVEIGLINTYYWYRLRASLRGGDALGARALRPRGPGLPHQRVRRRRPQVEQAPGRRAEVPRVPDQRGRPESHGGQRQLRIPDRLRCARLRRPAAVGQPAAGATDDRRPRQRPAAVQLLQQAQLL